ncbi:MAG: DUF4199 domain-containing protein [Verrucomicrobiota bacterium]
MKLPLELKWGLLLGLASLLWLYLSFWMGMHGTLLGIQVVTLVSLLISIVIYIFALGSYRTTYPESTYLEGLKAGAGIAGIAAVMAVGAQAGYHFVVNPGFTDFMVGETEKFYLSQGVAEDEARRLGEASAKTFGFTSYAIQAALGAIITGVVTSAIILLILKRKGI